ncbi:hypothetical protein PA01_06130 [Azoarcus sp. PA01]|nr:hypothetical protein PA01_06130 [Azoarcus sp. PA01]
MHRTKSGFPIGKLLLEVLVASGLSHRKFFEAIGCRDCQSASDDFNRWLGVGEGDPGLIEKVQASRFAVPKERLGTVMAANEALVRRRQILESGSADETARVLFEPVAQVIPEWMRPSQITIFGLMGGNARHHIQLPADIASWPLATQMAYLKKVVPEKYASDKGRTHFMGRIMGYLYRPSFEADPVRLTVEGEPDLSIDPYVMTGSVTITLKNGKQLG